MYERPVPPFTVQWENGVFVSFEAPHQTAESALKAAKALFKKCKARPFPSSVAVAVKQGETTVYYRHGAKVHTDTLTELAKSEQVAA